MTIETPTETREATHAEAETVLRGLLGDAQRELDMVRRRVRELERDLSRARHLEPLSRIMVRHATGVLTDLNARRADGRPLDRRRTPDEIGLETSALAVDRTMGVDRGQ